MSAASQVAELLPAARQCSLCGICVSVCPVFACTGKEADGPRGRMAIALGLLERRIEPAAAMAAFARCLLCGRCERACPEKLPIMRLFFALRHKLPLPAARHKLFLALSCKPDVQDFLQPPLSLFLGLAAKFRKPNLPALPLNPFVYKNQTDKPAKKQALLFAGCIIRGFYPHVAQDCVETLNKIGIAVESPAALVCCGRPLAVQGRKMLAAIKNNLAILSQYDFQWLAAPCPGCLDTIRNIWPNADGLSSEEKQQLEKIAAKSLDIGQLLSQQGFEAKDRGQHFWHRPCLMDDMANNAALALLKLEACKTGQTPACCGAPLRCLKPAAYEAPEQEEKRPAPLARLARQGAMPLPDTLAEQILRQAMSCGAESIATGCPGCMLALQSHKPQGGKILPVRHTIELLMNK